MKTSRGFHVYFRAPSELFAKLPDGELRGRNITILPPSMHPSGAIYRWIGNHPTGPSSFPLIDPVAAGLMPTTKRADRLEQRSQEGQEQREGTMNLLCANFHPRGINQTGREQTGGAGAEGGTHKSLVCQLSPEAFDRALWESVDQSLPEAVGQRHYCVFKLCRYLKALPHLTDAPGLATQRDCSPMVGSLAFETIGTKDFETTWRDFQSGWERVEFPKSAGPFSDAIRAAAAGPIPDSFLGYTDEPTRRLPNVCAKLQEFAGTGPFFLGCRLAGEWSGMPYRTAARRLNAFVENKVLERSSIGAYGSKKQKTLASEYRYQAAIARSGGNQLQTVRS